MLSERKAQKKDVATTAAYAHGCAATDARSSPLPLPPPLPCRRHTQQLELLFLCVGKWQGGTHYLAKRGCIFFLNRN